MKNRGNPFLEDGPGCGAYFADGWAGSGGFLTRPENRREEARMEKMLRAALRRYLQRKGWTAGEKANQEDSDEK